MARINSYKKWTSEELAFLRSHYGVLTAAEIADKLQRSEDSVWERADRDSLRKHAKRHARSVDGPWHCPSCKKEKPKEEFNNDKSGRGSPYCKECTNRKSSERRQAKGKK